MKVKKKYIGCTTTVGAIGMVAIEEHHGEMLFKHGMFEIIENVGDEIKNLKPLKPIEKEKKNKTKKGR